MHTYTRVHTQTQIHIRHANSHPFIQYCSHVYAVTHMFVHSRNDPSREEWYGQHGRQRQAIRHRPPPRSRIIRSIIIMRMLLAAERKSRNKNSKKHNFESITSSADRKGHKNTNNNINTNENDSNTPNKLFQKTVNKLRIRTIITIRRTVSMIRRGLILMIVIWICCLRVVVSLLIPAGRLRTTY